MPETKFPIGQYKTKNGLDAHVTAVVNKSFGTTYLVGFTQNASEMIVPMLWASNGQASSPRAYKEHEREDLALVPPMEDGERLWKTVTAPTDQAATKELARAYALCDNEVAKAAIITGLFDILPETLEAKRTADAKALIEWVNRNA